MREWQRASARLSPTIRQLSTRRGSDVSEKRTVNRAVLAHHDNDDDDDNDAALRVRRDAARARADADPFDVASISARLHAPVARPACDHHQTFWCRLRGRAGHKVC